MKETEEKWMKERMRLKRNRVGKKNKKKEAEEEIQERRDIII